MKWLQKVVDVKPNEIRALLISGLYFYLVLCTYYIFRPIRNEMTVANGVENVQWLFLLGMLVMFAIMPAFGWLTSRYRTKQFMAACTLFFSINLFVFFLLFNVEDRPIWVTRTFFVWVNVFNMFIVSLFWSFMNDVFSRIQAKRLFAFIAAGGTAGAITGPIITALLVEQFGIGYLLLIAAIVLASSILCINWLIRWENTEFEESNTGKTHQVRNKALNEGVFNGLFLVIKSPYLMAIGLFIVLYSLSIVFVTIQQVKAISVQFPDPIARTELFAKIDLMVNASVLFLQMFVTSHLLKRFGLRTTILFIPLGVSIGFVVVAIYPLLGVLIGLEVFRRAGDYAILKPSREMLFSVVSREEKYKAKNFIDTALLRTGDTLSSFLYKIAINLGAAGSVIPMIGVGLGLAWCSVGFWLGTQYQKRSLTSDALSLADSEQLESDANAANPA